MQIKLNKENTFLTDGSARSTLFGASGWLIGSITGYLYGDKIKSTYNKYQNQIIGGAQVAGGLLTVAGTIEGASLGAGTAVAVAFIGSDNIAAGMSRILTDEEVTTLGEDAIAWSGLVSKGYEGITYGLVDLALGSKTMLLSKIPSQPTILSQSNYLWLLH